MKKKPQRIELIELLDREDSDGTLLEPKGDSEEGIVHHRHGRLPSSTRRILNRIYYAVVLALGPIVFIVTCLCGGKKIGTAGLVCWVAWWWITEPIPLGITALMPVILLPLMGVSSTKKVTASYMNPTLMLFTGSFLMAEAVQRYNLHKRVALNTLLITGTKPGGILFGVVTITGCLSMWMSNTATSSMMVPLAFSLYESLFDQSMREKEDDDSENTPNLQRETAFAVKKFGRGLMLAVAYSASIGGVSTLVGTGPNLVLMETWQKSFGESIPFYVWLGFGLSYAVVMMAILWVIFHRAMNLSFAAAKVVTFQVLVYFAFTSKHLPSANTAHLKKLLHDLGPVAWAEWVISSGILCVIFLWLTRKKPILGWGDLLAESYGSYSHDYMPTIALVIILFIMPASYPFEESKMDRILTIQSLSKVPWEIVFLMGGGFALSLGIQESGLVDYVVSGVEWIENIVPKFALPLVVTALVTFATELVSNVAMASILLPVLAQLGENATNLALLPATLACSCAFMLPSATPPNAIAYSSGLIKVFPQMIVPGFVLNMIAIVVISIWCLVVAPGIFPNYTIRLG